jgi:hypothetical protein
MNTQSVAGLLDERGLAYLRNTDGDLVVPFPPPPGHWGLVVTLTVDDAALVFRATILGMPDTATTDLPRFVNWWNGHHRWPKAVTVECGRAEALLLGDLPLDGLRDGFAGLWFDIQTSTAFQFLDELAVAGQLGLGWRP